MPPHLPEGVGDGPGPKSVIEDGLTGSSFTTLPFDAGFVTSKLPRPLSEMRFSALPASSPVYGYVLEWAAAEQKDLVSATFAKQGGCDSDDEETRDTILAKALGTCKKRGLPKVAAGLGWFDLEFEGAPLHVLHQEILQPVATSCGIDTLKTVVIFRHERDGGQNSIGMLVQRLLEQRGKQSNGFFKVFRWHVKYQYWQDDETCLARSLDSVVIAPETKDELVDDMTDFQSAETCEWYVKNGIPYKRSYLFYGPPGAGKTSMVQALAGKFNRSICYLQLVHPEMTDDGLKRAVQKCPKNAIIVLEDIDALFNADRSVREQSGSLTFSGLLNSLDGIGFPMGQIFVMTTNHRERLDPALVRPGRVDLHVYFGPAKFDQAKLMFLNFYGGAEEQASRFARGLASADGGDAISMASLQSFFIKNRRSSPDVAADRFMDAVSVEEADGAKPAAGADKSEAEPTAGGKSGGGRKPRRKRKTKSKGGVTVNIVTARDSSDDSSSE